MGRQLLKNAIVCSCGIVWESRHNHDFVGCDKCQVYADGGNFYLRRVGSRENYKDCSVYDNGLHATRVSALRWGRNFNEKHEALPETEWLLIKDLNTSHIFKILEIPTLDKFYRIVLEEEIITRENEIREP